MWVSPHILFITTLPYKITQKHVITLTVKCPNMENKTVCKFRSKIKDIDRNSTLNIEPFHLGLIADLSCRCHFSDLV